MIRLFAAIEFPLYVERDIGGLIKQLKQDVLDVRWEDLEKLHITIAFFGNIREDRVFVIKRLIKRSIVGILPFTLGFSSLGYFLRSERLSLWLGVEKKKELQILKQSLNKELKRTGFSIDNRPFFPHVTIGRMKKAGKKIRWDEFVTRWKKRSQIKNAIHVKKIVLMRSTLTSSGSVYTVIESFNLGVS